METTHIWTDGACKGNPGRGGWSVVFGHGRYSDAYGSETQTTNNRMELTAVIKALGYLEQFGHITIHTDSKYVKDGITDWINKWKANGWRTSDKKPVKNQDLWMELDKLYDATRVSFEWVHGHAGHEMNERADELAQMAAG